MNVIHRHLRECAEQAAKIANGVQPIHMSGSTPCGEWDVRTLLNHWILYTGHGLEHRALRKQLPEELTQRDFTTDHDWAQRYATQLDRALAAWNQPTAWEGEIDLGYTQMPATEVASLLVKELAIHSWDVAHATGQQLSLSNATAEFVLQVVQDNAELYRQYDGFAAEISVPSGATALEKALAISGRDPRP